MHDDVPTDKSSTPSSPGGGVKPEDRAEHTPGTAELPAVPAWLDEVEGAQALAWVEERNAQTRATYAQDPGFTELAGAIETLLDSPDRIPLVTERAGMLYNFWTDADHPRGLWRRTTWVEYAAGAPGGGGDYAPRWEVLLDIDELGRQEECAWVWHGAQVLSTGSRAGTRALVTLSEGGADADITREFDLVERRFIPPAEGGFYRAASKGSMSWADAEGEAVLLLTDFGQGSLTRSGYPRQVRRMRRGQTPAQAEVLGTAARDDVLVSAAYDHWGRTWLTTAPDFHSSRTWLLGGAKDSTDTAQGAEAGAEAFADKAQSVPADALRLDVPDSALVGAHRDWLTIELRENWEVAGQTFLQGSLLATPLDAFLSGARDFTVLFTPTPSTCLRGAAWTRHHLVLTLLDDVVTRLEVLTPPAQTAAGQAWVRRTVDASALGQAGAAGAAKPGAQAPAEAGDGANAEARAETPPSLDVDPTCLRPGRSLLTIAASPVNSREHDYLWLSVSGWITPATLAVARIDQDGQVAGATVVRRAPARFNTEGLVVSQHTATSADGTAVPYFQIGTATRQGPAPTILYGYGGFEISLEPHYPPVVGRAWLERGGVYVVANIRGGGEYGPAWHRAALGRKRLRAYEDFAAVARSLSERGVTTPQRLAVHGGSNGGLLAGVMLTRYPELVGAVVCDVPLLDMRRYHELLAGHSWMAEYGDPDDPQQWAFIRQFSPFHLLRADRDYPPVLLVTSTRDDRVHPAHARTMAHRMRALGQEVVYFENSEGGHGAAATNAQRAFMSALTYEFCWRALRG